MYLINLVIMRLAVPLKVVVYSDIIFNCARKAALSPILEKSNISVSSRSRPADIFLPSWSNGRPSALDITVISSLQKATINVAGSEAGASLAVAENRKLAKHAAPCDEVGITFEPIAVEVIGGWSTRALKSLKRMAHMSGSRNWHLGGNDTEIHFFQQLSVVLQKGNANLIINRHFSSG